MSIDQAWDLLESAGVSMAYSEEDGDRAKLYAYVPSTKVLDLFSWIESYELFKLPDIDWEQQWQIHGMDFKDGTIHVNLEQFGGPSITLKLEPGPGFGDLSHPTTRLVLKLMTVYLQQQPVIDIGCGSGILSLAGIAMGSPMVYGIDIDEEALLHSQKNAEINDMGNKCCFLLPQKFKMSDLSEDSLIVMNMIYSEQKEAWEALPFLHGLKGLILTSGIMKEERDDYLKIASKWGWQLKNEIEEAGWLAFCFSN